MTSVCLIHAPSDREFAFEICRFLETGCDVACHAADGLLTEGESIVDRAENLGLSGDVLVILLSTASCSAGWPDRSRWERVLVQEARAGRVDVAYMQLDACAYPGVFSKSFPFFDAREDRLNGMRLFKRWLWQREVGGGLRPHRGFSPDLAALYISASDSVGTKFASADQARRFAEEASQDFAAVVSVPSSGLSLAQVLGAIGVELGMTLDGPVEENLFRVRKLLDSRRCLLVLEGASPSVADALSNLRQTSVVISRDSLVVHEAVDSFPEARKLVVMGRLAEAYEMFERLSARSDLRAMCKREIAWICNAWGKVEEANRVHPAEHKPIFAQQLSLFS